jgi:hypothetical protein
LRLDFPSFVFLFSALTFLCVAFYTFHPSFSLNFHALWAMGIMLAVLLSSAGSLLITTPANALKPVRSEVVLGILIFLFGLALGLYRLDYFSIWLDEEVTAFATRDWPGYSIVKRAATSQQMPLGYFFTALNWDLVGHSEWGLRLLPCIFIAASGVLFFRLAGLICKNRLLSSISPFIYLLNPWIIRYSQEGRPYGLIMFCCLLWLNSVHYLFSGPNSHESCRKGAQVVFACTLLFLLSASLQPMIFCASFMLTLGFLVFTPSWRPKVIALYASVILAILAVAPLIQLARDASTHYFFPLDGANPWERVVQGLQMLPDHVNHLFLGQANFLALVYLFAPLILIRPGQKTNGAILVGLTSCLAFGILFLVSFSLLINYPVFVRYFIVLYPLGLLLILAYFDQLSGYFETEKDRYFRWAWQLIFLAALAAPSVRALPDVYYSKKFDRWNVDYKSIFYFFQQTGAEGDVGYVIPFSQPADWEQNGFLATDYYYPANSPVRVTSFRRLPADETASGLILKDLNTQAPKQVFLAFIDLREPATTNFTRYCGSQPGIDLRVGDLFLICKVLVKDGLPKTLDRFFSGLIQAVEEKEKAYRLYDILLHLAEFEKNPGKCQSRLSDLKKLNSKSEVVQGIIQDHEKKCAGLSPRKAR